MRLPEARILFVLGLALFSSVAQAASAPDVAVYRGADRQARLAKGAKAEGEFVRYTSVNAEDSQRVVELFEKRYPFTKAKPVRLTSARIVQRHTPESQAGTFLADILDTSDSQSLYLLWQTS